MTRKQCATCPWKQDADTAKIPRYDESLHRNLRDTIATDTRFGGGLKMMACHYSKEGEEFACVGWLNHQLGRGNNVGLRLQVMTRPELADFEIDGPQRESFEATLPQRKKVCRGR